ncbi:hypothetical protein KAJ27_04125, partial [bacterium]|nr:hypothetical protein [bacterium]
MAFNMFNNTSEFTKIKSLVQQMEAYIQSGNDVKVKICVSELMKSPLFQDSMKDDQLKEITVMIYNYFIKVLGMNSDDMYGQMHILLTKLLCTYGHIEDISVFFQILLDSNNRFTIIYNLNNSQKLSELKCSDKSDKYCFYMKQQKKIISNKYFQLWLQQTPENFNTFTYHLDMLLNDLISFVRNKRKECFFALIDYYLLLIGTFPKLIWEFKPFKMVITVLDQSYIFKSKKARTRLSNLIADYQKKYNTPPIKDFMDDLIESIKWTDYEVKIVEELPQVESEELTIESVYKIAIEGFMKDGIISDKENEALQDLRSFMPISPQGYQKILRDCSSKIHTENGDSGDFSKEDFIYLIMLKALEDGILTSDEKNILAKFCKVFTFDKNTIQDLFTKAKTEITEGSKLLNVISPETKKSELLPELESMTEHTPKEVNTYYNQMVKELNYEAKVNSILNNSSYQNQKSYKLVQNIFENGSTILADEPSNMFNIKGDLANKELVVTDFWYDGHEEPIVIIYLNTDNIQPTRLKFRGNEIEAFFTGDPLQKMDTQTYCEDEDIYLFMYNRCLDTDIILDGITLYNNIPVFLDGMEKSSSNYKIALVDLKSLKPFKVFCNKGYVDASGLMSRGLKEMDVQNFTVAIKYFETLHMQNSKMESVLFNIGYCYKCIGM